MPAEEPAAIEASAAQQAQDAPACDHQWRTLGLYEQTEAATHEEEVPAVVETVEEPHTVCNTCYAVVDGATAEHTAATGHAGFTTDVPVPVEVVVQEAGVREVVDEPAEQRFTPILEWCPACGATQPAGQLEQAAQAAGEG